MKKISIIIPAYNCENYIERCIESIISQEYKNVEVLVVNDGSTDNTQKIIEIMSEKDKCIKIINQENAGVSTARNTGLKNATGDYISFVDADDYCCKDMFNEMVENIEQTNADIALIAYNQIINEEVKKMLFPWNDDIKIFSKEQVRENVIPLMVAKLKGEKSTIFGAVWRALIKRDIAVSNCFNENITIAEDLIYLIDCMLNAKTIVSINKCLYNYIKNSSSATNKYKPNYEETNENVRIELLKRYEKIGLLQKNSIRYGISRFTTYTLTLSNIMKNSEWNMFELRKEVKKITLNYRKDVFITKKILKELPLERKMIYIFFKLKLYTVITILFKFKNIFQNRAFRRKNK